MSNFKWTQVLHPDASAAVTASGAGNAIDVSSAKGAIWEIDVTAVTGTNPTMVWKVQINIDGTNWVDLDATNAATASTTATGRPLIHVYPGLTNTASGTCNKVLPALARLAWTIGGTATPTFTFATHVALIP